MINSFNVKAKTIIIFTTIGIIALIIICLAIALPIALNKRPDETKPDLYYKVEIGEHCTRTTPNGFYDLCFNKIYITETVNSKVNNNGGFLILEGQIDTPNFTFDTDILELELNLKKPTDTWTQIISFEKSLSITLSETPILFDENIGVMHGKIVLVFSIDENNYSLIRDKTSQTSFEKNQGAQIRFQSNVWWGKEGKTVFDFYTKNVEVVNTVSF